MNMNETTFENAKAGDQIYSMVHGCFLRVKKIVRSNDRYYIVFEDGSSCTMDGCHYNDKGIQTYFWDKPQVIVPVKPVCIPKKDELVEVLTAGNWMKRYSAGYMNEGCLVCFDDGRTSHTVENEDYVSYWKTWRAVDSLE